MAVQKYLVSRRAFMRLAGAQLLTLLINSKLQFIPALTARASSQNTPYGSGPYGQGPYPGQGPPSEPGHQLYLPVVIKEAN